MKDIQKFMANLEKTKYYNSIKYMNEKYEMNTKPVLTRHGKQYGFGGTEQ